jgi:hypothetical protein
MPSRCPFVHNFVFYNKFGKVVKSIVRKLGSIFISLVILGTILLTVATPFSGETVYPENLLTTDQSTFEGLTVPVGWGVLENGNLSTLAGVSHSGSKSLKLASRAMIWDSPVFNIYNILKDGGSGTYFASLWVRVDNLSNSPSMAKLLVRGTQTQDNSFINPYVCDCCPETNYYAAISPSVALTANTWVQLTGIITIQDSDIVAPSGTFNLCIDGVGPGTNQNLYIDDVQIVKPASTVGTAINTEISFISDFTYIPYVTGNNSTFEDGTLNGWQAFAGGQMFSATNVIHGGNYSVKLNIPSCNSWETWFSPYKNIYSTIKAGGAGTYNISYWVYADSLLNAPRNGRMIIRADSAGQYSFLQQGTNYAGIGDIISTGVGTWTQYFGKLTVTASDISAQTGTFNLMLDGLSGVSPQNIYIDDFKIYKTNANLSKDLTLDVTFVGPGNTTVVVPGYSESSNVWKVNFAPANEGIWNYTTTCSNVSDTGLHGKTGVIGCASPDYVPLNEDIITTSASSSINDLQKWIIEYTGSTKLINGVTEQVVNIRNKASSLYLTRNSDEGYIFVTEKTVSSYQDWVMVQNGGNLLISPASGISRFLSISAGVSIGTVLSPLEFTYPVIDNMETAISANSISLQSGIVVDFGLLSTNGAYINNFTPSAGFNVSDIKAEVRFGKFTDFLFKNGLITLNDTDSAGTGTTIEISYPVNTTYTVIIYGDVTGDGNISIGDLAGIKQDLLRSEVLSGAYSISADVTRNSTVTVSDLIMIKKHLLGIIYINQA